MFVLGLMFLALILVIVPNGWMWSCFLFFVWMVIWKAVSDVLKPMQKISEGIRRL